MTEKSDDKALQQFRLYNLSQEPLQVYAEMSGIDLSDYTQTLITEGGNEDGKLSSLENALECMAETAIRLGCKHVANIRVASYNGRTPIPALTDTHDGSTQKFIEEYILLMGTGLIPKMPE